MSGLGEIGELEVLARRLEILDEIESGPVHKPDIVENLPHSRSTVDRAIDELEDAGFIERITRGYVPTQTGRIAATQYRRFIDDFEGLLAASDVVDAIPAEYELPPEVVTSGTVRTVEGPYEMFARVTDLVESVDSYRVMLPELVDSRHVRLWHSQVVRGDCSVDVLAPPSVFDQIREELPTFTSELAQAEGFSAGEVDAPRLGFVIADGPTTDTGSPTGSTATDSPSGRNTGPALIISYTPDGVTGFISCTSPSAVTWVESQYEQLCERSTPVTDQLGSDRRQAAVTSLLDSGLPTALRSEGFVQIDDELFEQRRALAPQTGWRVGLGLPEVADGQAVERRLEDGTALAQSVTDRLTETDVVVLGPGGSGKSTLCKQIACQWRDRDEMTVLYRESGGQKAFTSTAVLEQYLRNRDGQVLVVVEDAVRTEANDIFRVMDRLSGRDDVSFLLDSRTGEWHNPDVMSLDARIDAFRRQSIDAVSMPALDEDDSRDLVSSVESLVDTSIEADPAELLRDVRDEDDASKPGTMLLLTHRLAQLASPVSEYEASSASTLDDDIDNVRADLAAIGDTALDVGLLVNALNAADVELKPEFAYALVRDGNERTATQVESALERLDGEVLVTAESPADCRSVHEAWSVRYLERHLEADGEQDTRRRFGRCLSTLLELAENPSRCDRISQLVDGDSQALDAIVTDPASWADETVEALHQVAKSNGRLAPLFGTTGEPAIDLPSVCSDRTVLRCIKRRGDSYVEAGEFDTAREEFEQIADIAAERGLQEFVTESKRLLGAVARYSGNHERASDYYEQALAEFRAAEDRLGEARTLNDYGTVMYFQGAYDQARTYHENALDIARDIGATRVEADALTDRGLLADACGNPDQARERLEAAVKLHRDIDNRSGECAALVNLGLIELDSGNYETSRSHLERALDIARDRGDQERQNLTLGNLGTLARLQGQYEQARQYRDEAIDIARNMNADTLLGYDLNQRGVLAQNCESYDRAREFHERALEIAQDGGVDRLEAACRSNLGEIARQRNDIDEATEYLSQALDLYEALGEPLEHAQAWLRYGKLALYQNDVEKARERAEEVAALLDELHAPCNRACYRRFLGQIAAADGQLRKARDHYQQALQTFEEIGALPEQLTTLELLVEISRQLGEDETATEYSNRATAVCEDAPPELSTQYRDTFDQRQSTSVSHST